MSTPKLGSEIPAKIPTQAVQFSLLEAQLLDTVSSRDLFRLKKQLNKIQHSANKAKEQALLWEKWSVAVAKSQRWVASRTAGFPKISLADLPVSERADEIRDLIRENQVVVIAGETGSGKTTQLPKICLEAGCGRRGIIGHTQPRRIAARSVASRIAEELNTNLGDKVGYQVRFADQTNRDTLIKLMTDGILLAEIQQDRYLSRYDCLIIDEAHERSLNIDFLLGYLKQILPYRPDLKVIITSATIDVEKFSVHFNDAPVVEVSGRTYPVEIVYDNVDQSELELDQQIIDRLKDIEVLGNRGDVLVFLSGEREIREVSLAIRRAQIPHLDVVPLYARLSLAEQRKIFSAHKGRRVVLSTNVAETSLTVPGIGYVIDAGRARLSRYSYRTKVQRLPIEPISQASANQRAGRCGRVQKGTCYRLYTEEDFVNRPEYTDPEIIRTNLAAVILQMLHARIGDIRDFPFIDKPDSRMINDGYKLLEELQAVDKKGALTRLGKMLVAIPLDPKFARMLVEASELGCLNELMIITAGLSIQDPRERPSDKQQAADLSHKQWLDDQSDFLSLVNIWRHFEEKRQQLSRNQFSKYCRANYISPLRMKEWRDLHHQVHSACRGLGLNDNNQPADYKSIHCGLLSGLLGQVANRQDKWEFLGTRNRKLFIFPGSGLSKQPPKWIVAGSLMETAKQYALNVAKIEPEWLSPLASHLVKKTYAEPFYHRRGGQVMAKERQTLFGLTIVDGKLTPYGKIAPEEAREVFIQQALVENGYRGNAVFLSHNQALLDELQALEDRFRRRDLVAEQKVVFQFYNDRVPQGIYNRVAFDKWRSQVEREDPSILKLSRDLLLLRGLSVDEQAQFPQQVSCGGLDFTLCYRFEPGHREDGVTAVIPLPILHQAPRFFFEWLVPGMLRDKCIALIKGLPKQIRRHFVPVPDYVDKILLAVKAQDRPLTEVLAEQLHRLSGVSIADSDWRSDSLDPWYLMNFRLEDENAKGIAVGRSLQQLQLDFKQQINQGLEKASNDSICRQKITAWDFDELPEQVSIARGNITIKAWPCLRDCGEWVDIELRDNPLIADNLSAQGQLRLALLKGRDQVKYLNKNLLRGLDLALKAAAVGDRASLVTAIISASFRQAIFVDGQLIRCRDSFEQSFDQGVSSVVGIAQKYADTIESLLPKLHQCHRQLRSMNLAAVYAKSDIEAQIQRLFSSETLASINLQQITQYPRFMRALEIRLEKLPLQVAKDRQYMNELQNFLAPLHEQLHNRDVLSRDLVDALDDFAWAVEEYRVSLFAQQLKTRVPISAKRLHKQWDQLYQQLRRFL
jgi:ATP-dependent helicase HrpA